MKKYIYTSLMMALVSMFSFSFVACGSDDDDVEAPVIVIKEANIEEDELCVEANVVAKGRTAAILLEIFDSTGNTRKVSKQVTDAKYLNVLNIDEFHVHVDIAGKNIVVNDMLKFTVTDANGSATTAQKSITHEEDDDHHEHEH